MTLKQVSNTILSMVIGAGFLFGSGYATAGSDQASIAEGKKIAFNRKKGNCLACHMIADGSLPGDIGLRWWRRRYVTPTKPICVRKSGTPRQ